MGTSQQLDQTGNIQSTPTADDDWVIEGPDEEEIRTFSYGIHQHSDGDSRGWYSDGGHDYLQPNHR